VRGLTIEQIDEMTVAEKLQAMEILWESLARNSQSVPLPAWHGEVLAARQRQIEQGQAEFHSLDEVRQNIRNLIESDKDKRLE
jgi:hypothetical protein